MNFRSAGRHAEAIATFRQAIELYPNEPTLYNNLAVTLEESGDGMEALAVYRQAAEIDPLLWPALFGAATQLVRAGQFEEAEQFFNRTLQVAPDHVPSHLAIYELAQIRKDRATALIHQAVALTYQQLFTEASPTPARTLLALMAPGDWQVNVPVDLLFDRKSTTWHKLYLLGDRQLESPLPPYDVIFNAIAESDEAALPLELCERLIAKENKPVINAPQAVRGTKRSLLPGLLRGTGCNVPDTKRLTRKQIELGEIACEVPFLIRPVGSHAGLNLEKIEKADALGDYLARVPDKEFYLTAFVDYRSEDGYYRKYRIILVDGVPFPFHLAIAKRWMLHFYNSDMLESGNDWMRAEEERWMADFDRIFTLAQQRCLREVAKALQLDYFGIDCALDSDGRVLIFEADPGVIVHAADSPELFPYKHTYVPRIFRAVERLIDSRIARSR
ncbi:MAG: tetratricopeptide repeat protein [Candidatus Baltobacteraceae bacterium]